jgi:hypothetical protein
MPNFISLHPWHHHAPNIHYFGFQLTKDNPDYLWDYYEKTIKKYFGLPSLKKEDVSPIPERKAYLNENSPAEVFQALSGKLEAHSITGLACPLLLYDSYGLAINLRIPEKQDNQPTDPVDLETFSQFNPDQIFCPEQFNSNLGQTILLTAWLIHPEQHQRENWPQIAHQIIKNFLGDQDVPPLYQSGQLFGSPIYEYGSPKTADAQGKISHYWVWLFIDDTADHCLGSCYLDLIDLWFYRQKITTAYHYSRLEFADLKEQYEEIRQTVRNIHQNLPDFDQNPELSEQHLTDLKQNLKTLPKLDLDYTDRLTPFQNRALTLEINTHDYQVKLERIAAQTRPQDLTILAVFGEKIAVTFQRQIADDLGYFDRGSQLVDKVIATIRGLVEIDQAERDRQRQKAERNLQDSLQALGVGIAAGAIVASTTGLLTHPWQWPPQRSAPVHPLVVAVCLSSAIAVFAWTLTHCILTAHREGLTLAASFRKLLGQR